jgi:hypothetical protein
MIHLASLLIVMASMGSPVEETLYADDVKNDAGIVIAIYRSAGNKNPERITPIDYYQFTVIMDGKWEFKPLKGESRKGRLDAEDLDKWLKAIEADLDEVESNPMLGALDESYMDITLQTRRVNTRVRIRLSEKLSQAIENEIVELLRGAGS